MQQLSKELRTGKISINVKKSTKRIDELFEFAERKNPKRSFLFVSKVLGKHVPVFPHVMNEVYEELASKLPIINDKVLMVGMAETAVGLAAGFYRSVKNKVPNSVLLTSTRHPIDGELLCEFKENHSHATDHLIYWPISLFDKDIVKNAQTLILVDDEATTGNTFKNLAKSLMNSGLSNIKQIYTITLTDWSNGSLFIDDKVKVTHISIANGEWCWEQNPNAELPTMPNVNITAKGNVEVSKNQDWGRQGLSALELKFGKNICVDKNEKILVLGTGEFLWQPFLLAEKLEKMGISVKFGSTTRSPISDGLAIKSSLAFLDNYGLAIPNYVYNISHENFDRIIICIETSEESANDLYEKLIDANIAKKIDVLSYDED